MLVVYVLAMCIRRCQANEPKYTTHRSHSDQKIIKKRTKVHAGPTVRLMPGKGSRHDIKYANAYRIARCNYIQSTRIRCNSTSQVRYPYTIHTIDTF